MQLERFTCCQKDQHFERIKKGYKCMDCGRVFLRKTLDYNGKTILLSKWYYNEKIRGRRADYIKIKNNSVFSTLQTGRVNLMHISDRNVFLDKTSIKVKKAVMRHVLNFNNTFLTITVNGVVDVYNMETGEKISQLRSGKDYYNIKILPLGKKGKWLYIDTEKINCLSCDLLIEQKVICLEDIFGNEIISIRSVDCNAKYDCFVIHILYRIGQYMKRASIVLRYKDDVFDSKILKYEAGNELTYIFDSGMYYGVNHDEMIRMDDSCKIEKICKLPVVRSYSDGGGIFWVQEFIGFPEKLYFLTDNVIALRYHWEIVIFDIQKQEIILSIEGNEGNLIQSFFIMGEGTICFSEGLNTYIVQLDLD